MCVSLLPFNVILIGLETAATWDTGYFHPTLLKKGNVSATVTDYQASDAASKLEFIYYYVQRL